MRKTTALVIFCLLFAVRALPQAATGSYPLGTFENKGFDTINLGNLNITAAIPIVDKPGRAGTSFTYTLVYNGLIWYPVGASGSQTWTNVQNWGWQAQTEVLTGYVSRKEVPGECLNGGHFPRLVTSGAIYHDAFGGSHAFSGTIIDSSGECSGDLDTLSNSWSQDTQKLRSRPLSKCRYASDFAEIIDGACTLPPQWLGPRENARPCSITLIACDNWEREDNP